jgi:hypothetical protein
MNTWDRYPQDERDDHDWVAWFDDASKYRGMIWSYGLEQWVREPSQ